MEFDFKIDTTGPKELVLIRFINAWARSRGGEYVFITPDIEEQLYGITLKTIQATLTELSELEHIEIEQRPNHKLTDAQRERRDDEEDYYLISVNDSFYSYYESFERTAALLKSDTAHALLTPTLALASDTKIRYDKANRSLTYAGLSLQINGVLRQEVCRCVFKNRRVAALYNDILDNVDPNKQSRAVYDAMIAINKSIEQAFGLPNVLVQQNESIRISKKYL